MRNPHEEGTPIATRNHPNDAGAGRPSDMRALRQQLPFSVGGRLAELRKYRGLTQRRFAAQLGVDHSLISKLEQGIQRVDADLIPVFAARLGVEPGEFFRSGPPSQTDIKQELAKTVAQGWKYFPPSEREFLEAVFREILHEHIEPRPDDSPGN